MTVPTRERGNEAFGLAGGRNSTSGSYSRPVPYGQFTAKKLEQMTHEEPQWEKTTRNRPIDHGLLRTYFLEVVRAGKDGNAPAGRPAWPTNSFRFQGRLAISESMAPFRERLRAAAATRTARVDA
jgi:hypothetical protein